MSIIGNIRQVPYLCKWHKFYTEVTFTRNKCVVTRDEGSDSHVIKSTGLSGECHVWISTEYRVLLSNYLLIICKHVHQVDTFAEFQVK